MGLVKSIVKVFTGSSVRGGDGDLERKRHALGNPFAMPTSSKQDAALQNGNAIKRKALKNNGVDVDILTAEKICADALDVANRLCDAKIRSDKRPAQVGVKWQNLTKAGKLPRKVAETTVVFDWQDNKSTIVHVWYLSSFDYYAADVYMWKNSKCKEFTVRTVDGKLSVQHISVYDADSDSRSFIQ